MVVLLLIGLFRVIGRSIRGTGRRIGLLLEGTFIRNFLCCRCVFPRPIFIIRYFLHRLGPLGPYVVFREYTGGVTIFFGAFGRVYRYNS